MIDVDIVFTGIAVTDFGAARDWYRRLFGRGEDVVVTADEVMWHFADAAWVYVVRDEERAGRALVALCVADLEQALADIDDRGIPGGPIETVGEGARKAVIHDLDGNSVSLIEVGAA